MEYQVQPHKSSLGNVDANVMALLAYFITFLVGLIPGVRNVAWALPIVLFFIESGSGFVKFHALQAFILNIVGFAIGLIVTLIFGGLMFGAVTSYESAGMALGMMGIVGILSFIVTVVLLIFSIMAAIKAYQYKEYRLPLIGKIVDAFYKKN